jgi:hypothetical protein
MASTPIRATRSHAFDPDDAPLRAADRRDLRLAELVAGLTACDDELALESVCARRGADDPLEVVARAITGIRRATEPQDRFRVAGFLRATSGELPRRRGARSAATSEHAAYHLVHHGSLRRWERTGADDEPVPAEARVDDVHGETVIDLRDRTARFRRPGPTDRS